MKYDEAQKITFKYSQLISADAKKIPFFSKSKLPYPEDQITQAILMLAQSNREQEEWMKSLEIFYVYLAHFIDEGDFERFCKLVIAARESQGDKTSDDFNLLLESSQDLKTIWQDINALIERERKLKREEFNKLLA